MDGVVSWLAGFSPQSLHWMGLGLLVFDWLLPWPVMLAMSRAETRPQLNRWVWSCITLAFIAGGVGAVSILMSPVGSAAGYLGWFGSEILSGLLLGVAAGLMLLSFLGVPLMAVIWLAFCLVMAFSLVGGRLTDLAHPIKTTAHVESYLDSDDKQELALKESDVLKVPSDRLWLLLVEKGITDTPPKETLRRPLTVDVVMAPDSEFIFLADEYDATPRARRWMSVQLIGWALLVLSSLLSGILVLLAPLFPVAPPAPEEIS